MNKTLKKLIDTEVKLRDTGKIDVRVASSNLARMLKLTLT